MRKSEIISALIWCSLCYVTVTLSGCGAWKVMTGEAGFEYSVKYTPITQINQTQKFDTKAYKDSN